MALAYPKNQLTILDYNRVVKDLNNKTPAEIITELEKCFKIEKIANNAGVKPT